jgi:hypothetical protein
MTYMRVGAMATFSIMLAAVDGCATRAKSADGAVQARSIMGPKCKSSLDCGAHEECAPDSVHPDPDGSGTCQIACNPVKTNNECPAGMHCAIADDGPRTSKLGMCMPNEDD